MKRHRVKIQRYLLTASWEVRCYECDFYFVSPWWWGIVVVGVTHYDSENLEACNCTGIDHVNECPLWVLPL
jgi:hypothetical protein